MLYPLPGVCVLFIQSAWWLGLLHPGVLFEHLNVTSVLS